MRVTRTESRAGVEYRVTFGVDESHPLRNELDGVAEPGVRQVNSLATYYRVNGESEYVARVESVLLAQEWLLTADVVARSGCSFSYVMKCLAYLHEEGRAERQWKGRKFSWRRKEKVK